MSVLITNPIILPERLDLESKQNSSSLERTRLMSSRRTCLCCSNALLRHICLGKLYWRCNRCYQAMPVMEDARKMPFSVSDEPSFQQLLVSLNKLWQQRNFAGEGRDRLTHPLPITSVMVQSV